MSVSEYEEDQLRSEEDDDFYPDEEDDGTFRIRGAVKPPNAEPWSTEDLHRRIHEGVVDLSPPYQRDVVWPESKQIGLIDSIFRNYYIPPVIFAMTKDDDGDVLYTCVDGKQRLTSITKFMDGQIPHIDPVTKKKYWFTTSEKRTKRLELPEPYRKQFKRKQMTCVVYNDLVPGTERDIFQRVQLGMTLTSAEKLQAIASPLSNMISDLQVQYIDGEGGISHIISWETKRGREFQNVATLAYCCWNLPTFAAPSLVKLEKWLGLQEPPSARFQEQMKNIFRKLIDLATNEKYNKAFTRIEQRVAPVEFLFLGILLAKMRHSPMEEIALQAYMLRSQTRAHHKDIRSNIRVMKYMWGIVEQVETGDEDPYDDWEAPGSSDHPRSKPASNGKKRGRPTKVGTSTPAKKPRTSTAKNGTSSTTQASSSRARVSYNKPKDVKFVA